MSNWPIVTLSSLCNKITSGGTPSRSNPENFTGPGRHQWVKSAELLDTRILEAEEHISDKGLSGSSAKYLPEETVLVAMYGANVGQLGLLGVPATVNQAVCGLIVDRKKAEPRYVFYALMQTRSRLIAQAKGAAQQNLSATLIKNFSIPAPPLPIQRRIASILGAYDDLIEVNRRRIAVLEEMARRLFDEWFVHFRFPGHEGHPMVETDQGRIPEGWCWAPLEDFLVLQRGFDLPSQDREAGEVPLVSASGISGTHSVARIQAPGIVTGRSGTIGGVFFIHDDFWPLNTTLYVKEFKRASPTFALHLLRNLDLKSRAVGAAVPTLNRNHVHGLLLPCPPMALVGQFEEHASTLLKAVRGLERSQATLAASRDLLLPRLISGELPVSAAEAALETAA
jgi:type I restriction enzyme S subunit